MQNPLRKKFGDTILDKKIVKERMVKNSFQALAGLENTLIRFDRERIALDDFIKRFKTQIIKLDEIREEFHDLKVFDN